MRHPLGIFLLLELRGFSLVKNLDKKLAYSEKNIKIQQFLIFSRAFAVNLFCHKTTLPETYTWRSTDLWRWPKRSSKARA